MSYKINTKVRYVPQGTLVYISLVPNNIYVIQDIRKGDISNFDKIGIRNNIGFIEYFFIYSRTDAPEFIDITSELRDEVIDDILS